MLVLFDHGTPLPLAPRLTGHRVKSAKELGWDPLSNGELLVAAAQPGSYIEVEIPNP